VADFNLGDLSLDRRSFLRRGAVGGAGLAVVATGGLSALLAACGSSSKPAASTSGTTAPGGAKDLGTLDFQLSWVKDAEFAGEYIADTKGYYTQQGFSKVNLISGGPNVAQDAQVASGKAIICISSPDITAAAINQGAAIISIGAQYQKNPFAITSLAKKPIKTPQDMYGKKIGVQATNESIWNAFVKANNLDASKINKVPVQFDPTPLATGDVDGWFAFITNEPNLLKVKGVDTFSFLLADNNYPLVSETYVVRAADVQGKRDTLKAILKAEIMGWHDSIADPSEGATLAVNKYGKDQGLTLEPELLESQSQNELIQSSDTATNGIFTITPELMQKNIATLKIANINIAQDKLFDMSLIDEVYQENPDLKTTPASPPTTQPASSPTT
jgi:ABC-type nitrate/sulfonate/bicarbonate transport system substrate-binding protein